MRRLVFNKRNTAKCGVSQNDNNIRRKTTQMKRIGILHISDVHINASSIAEIDTLVAKLIKDIEKVKVENSINIDLICFAGDLIGRGDKAQEDENQLRLAEEHFIQPLLKVTGLTERDFILVPGNHEVDIRKIAKRTEAGLASISSLEEVNETIYEMQQEYKSRLQYFYDYMREKYISDAETWNLGYSIIREVNGISIGIVGLDSAWRSTGSGGTERGKMLVGEHQVGTLFENIKDTDLKICLMHHPLDWLSDLEMTSVERKLKCFDLVLRGHVHDLDDKQICTQRYKTIYNTSGKLYPIDTYYSGYSIMDIDMDLYTCSIYSREYLKSPREDFDKALRINEDGKVEYQLNTYDETRAVMYDLKLQLQKFYENIAEKYTMLKNIDSYSPDKVDDFFVEPILFEKKEYVHTKSTNPKSQTEIPISLTYLITDTNNILIIGKKECGKTTILQRFGISYANSDDMLIPIYIDMMKLTKGQDRILIACQNFIFNNVSLDMPITKEQVQNILANGKVICLFDNVNVSNVNHITWIKTFTQMYPNNRFIFAAEEKFYQTYSLKELPDFGVKYKSVRLSYFNKRQVRAMVSKWGKGKAGFDANEMTRKIVTYCNNTHFTMTPFNIAVFMTIWDVDKSFVPINEGKVMRTYLETVLDKFSVEEFQRSEYNYDVKQHFLGYLAYAMCQKDKYFFTVDEFDSLVEKYHSQKGFRKSQTKFDEIFFQKNILCRNGEHVYFSNTSIMEYCLAVHATVNLELYELMTAKENRANFMHELSFYSGIVADCSTLLNSLNDEITATILENMDVLDEIEKLSIGIEFNVDKEELTEIITQNRSSIEEIDDLDEAKPTTKEASPMEITKIKTVEESEDFFNMLLIYGAAIKNAETIDKEQKRIHLENYILGMNFQFSLLMDEFSARLMSKMKEDLPDEIKEKHPDLTDEEYNEFKKSLLELFKVVLPIGIQFCIRDNVGTPKLEVVISDLIQSNRNKKFTRFMLSFLQCDIGNGNIKTFLMNYINEEDSKDILKLILSKLSYYYNMWYFGDNSQIDSMLIDLISEVRMKLSGENNLKAKVMKGRYVNQVKQQCDEQRKINKAIL